MWPGRQLRLVSSLEGAPTLVCLCATDTRKGKHRVDIGDTSTVMGGSSSKPTVLECRLKHFKKGFSGDYVIKMSPRRLHMLCELE
jgi:hypothetical protein